ncbi:hypothetical protein [Thiofilum flexile]|uniref:hypothetical protein n=1 Tax=Thiofilum flexile TaxID=125627 RepID=UPI0003771CC5|nr:hypothetical protein [Thiofilum flexile]
MMMQNDILKASMLTISPHNRAILEFFFAGAGKNLFRITPAHEAETFIIDYDHPGAHEEWERIHLSQSQPCIIISIRDIDLPNSIWVAKPLTTKALADAAQRVQLLLQNHNKKMVVPASAAASSSASTLKPVGTPIPSTRDFAQPALDPVLTPKVSSIPASAPQSFLSEDISVTTLRTPFEAAPKTNTNPSSTRNPKLLLVRDTVTPMVEPTSNRDSVKQQQRWSLLCGTLPDTTPENLQRDRHIFDANQYLLGSLMEATQQAKKTGQVFQVFITRQHYILLLPQPNYAFSSLDIHGAEFADLCTYPITSNQVHIHIPTAVEQAQLDAYVQQHPTHLYDLDACLWTTTLLTSGGRLHQLYDPNKTYRLKHWPNLTRMESIPHVMSIAALWTQQAATPFDIAKQLGIPQRYVFAFHSASSYLLLLHQEQAAPTSNSITEPKKNRGLFSRLLKRLLGGGAK